MRIIEWFWRSSRPQNLGACRNCGRLLRLCPACGGGWRACACRACQLGLVCPEHRNYWI